MAQHDTEHGAHGGEHAGIHLPDPSVWPLVVGLAFAVVGGALIWWRFYTFYIYILLGALAAGNTVMRAVRKTEDYEAEVVA